jgi:signal transduction histidine kinase
MVAGRSRPRSRRFWVLAALFGLFLVSDIALFSWLIFRSLSQRELDRVLLETRQEARDLAGQIERGAERSGGDLFTAVSLEQETLTYIDSVLRQRHIVQTLEITDRDGILVMKRRTEGELAVPSPATPPRPREIAAGAPRVETRTVERQESKNLRLPAEAIEALDVTVPIGEFGSLRIGLSALEMERRIETLRRDLVGQAAVLGGVTLGLIGAAVLVISVLVRRGERLQAQAAEAERLAYLGTLAAGLAHEIRNPLNSLSLNMQMLEEDLANPASQVTSRRLFGITRAEITRLERLVTDFLAYARPRPLRLAVRPAAGLLATVRELVAAQIAAAGAEVVVEDRSEGAMVRVDAEQLQQVLLNLLQNALAATEGTGRPPRVVLRSRRNGPAVTLEVEDNGAGIAAEDRARVFELFFSTRKGGTGLGLAIAERIVTAHGGTIGFEPGSAYGTCFTISLPVAAGAPARADS